MNTDQIDITKLLAEAGEEVDALIKAEKEKLEALKKSEESSKEESSAMKKKEESSEASKEASMKKKEEMPKNKANGDVQKKEESSKEMSMKKDEGSGYQSQAPEASDESGSQQDPAAPPADPQADPNQGEDLNSMVSSLDDEMLHELMQVVQMEMQARQEQQSPDQSQPQMDDSSAQPQESAPPQMEKMAMAYKSELSAVQQKLAKSEEEASNLYKSVSAMTELMDKMINRPVSKAVTDIRHIDYVDKGEKELKKSETENISDADLQKKAKEFAMDNKRLGTLVKNERDVLSDYLVNKKRSPEILKIISK